MAKAKRVFEVAKELGVDSKAIVAKCQAEGVPGITNHMSTVKLGLAQTIHEWFGDAAVAEGTAIETTEKVDIEKVRKPARRRAAKKSAKADEPDTSTDEGGGVATETAEPTEAPAPSAPVRRRPRPAVEAQPPTEPQADTSAEQPSTEAESTEAAPAAEPPTPPAEATPEKPKVVAPMGMKNVPTRPDVIKPVGELAKPQQAQLKGPNVVRIEKPDNLAPPRPRRPAGGGGGGMAPTAPDEADGITRSRGPARGRGAGGGGQPADTDPARRKRRSLSTRRGRTADALPTGPTKFSEADLAELDARLNRASGFLKQRRRHLKSKEHTGSSAPSPAETGGKVEIVQPISIKSLSAATGIKSVQIIKYLFAKGIMATINSVIDAEAAMEVALEYDIELVVREQQTAEQRVLKQFQDREPVDVRSRPPVVTVLGHVDHGKTSLLDRIRKADVAAHEAGGITQHVGAYRVTVTGTDGKDKTVVFLDTPGHEAFTSMRSRGAKMTDLVVLVVAADDGVMPQTIESINHAKAAEVPIVVALNKIDRPEATEANIQKVYGQLAEHGLNPTEWGGDTEVVKVSAIEGTGVTELLEIIDYQAELRELTADYGGAARGTVIEAEMQPGRGPVARILVQDGQLKIGDFIVIGRAFGRVRDMTDDRDRPIREAGPATPLELSGIDRIPDAGDKVYVTSSLQAAESVAMQFREAEREIQLASQTKVTLDNFSEQIAAGTVKELRVVLKADVQGSMDVLAKSLGELGNDEVAVRVLHSAVGGISESDVLLADASDAVIIGFHVSVPAAVRDIAEERGVDVRLYRVIYDVTDDVKKALEGMLTPEVREDELGTAEVREIFKVSKIGTVAGCLVTNGSIQKSGRVRVIRDGVVVTDDRPIESLRRVKDDVREVRQGTECGIRVGGFDDVKPGDELVCYNKVTIERKLD